MDSLPPTLRNRATPRVVALDDITIPETRLRRTPTTPAQDAGLAESVRILGILQPIILRADPAARDRYILVKGARRIGAARAAGLRDIPAALHTDITEADAAAIEAATTIQRAAMAPVDLWRHMVTLQDLGWTLENAGEALGLSARRARQLNAFGRLHPTLLAAIEQGQEPPDRHLQIIAAAPRDAQAAALAKHHKGGAVHWWQLAEALTETRIPKTRAIFDADASGIAWQEDLFAEPGTDWHWFTRDAAAFNAAQRAAVQAVIDGSKGKIAWGTLNKANDFTPPKGHTLRCGAWRWGEKLPRGTVGLVLVTELGEIRVACAQPPAKPKPAKDAKASAAPAEADGAEDDDAGEDDEAPPAPAPPAAKPRFTEAGRLLLGERRTIALRTALRDRPPYDLARAMILLLMALDGENVTVQGEDLDGEIAFGDIAAVAHACWDRARDDAELERLLGRLAQEAVARILKSAPVKGYNARHSGDAAERIGWMIGAEQCMPPLDDEALLGAASIEALRDAAAEASIACKPGDTGKAIRAKLLGKAGGALIFPEARFTRADPPAFPEPYDAVSDGQLCGQSAGDQRCLTCGWNAAEGKAAQPCGLGLWRHHLARLGLTPGDVVEDAEGELRVVLDFLPARRAEPAPAPEDHDAQRQQDAEAFDGAPAAPFQCAWNGKDPCAEEGTYRCGGTCPRKAKYEEWLATPEGQRARREQQNRDARAALKRGRRKGSTAA